MAYQANLGYDPDLRDYSAVIANETNAAKRQELLRQRQNKLDHLSGQGKADPNWSSNNVVSSWTASYQPGGWNDSTGSYNPYDILGTPYRSAQAATPRSVASQSASNSAQTLMEELTRQAELAASEQQRALEAAITSSVDSLEVQKKSVDADYSAMARQAYINYMRGKEALPHALTAGGLSGGASESALAALDISYQENLYQGDLARRSSLDAIDAAVSEVRAQGSIEQAQAAAEQARLLADALQKQYAVLLEQSRWEQQFEYNTTRDAADRAARQAQQQKSEEQETYKRQLELAKLLAAAGDFSGYQALGVDTSAMEAEWAAQKAQAAAKSGSSAPGKSGATASFSGTAATDSDLLQAQTGSSAAGLVEESSLSPVERAAVVYIEDLATLYANNTGKMQDQIEDDYARSFISQELAAKAMGLLRGSWRVLK